MAISDPTNTLAWHKSRPFCSHIDASQRTCLQVAQAFTKYQQNHSSTGAEAVPEGNALWFYGMNHAVSLISAKRDPLEPMDNWEQSILSMYHMEMVKRTSRAFYYLLMICIREARHNGSLIQMHSQMASEYGKPIADFFVSINGGEHTIHSQFLSNPPDGTIGQFTECLRWQFYKCKWSSGFGGKAWGVVADCLVRFVNGEYTAEMMLDTIWTLCHNNGPIFNKQIFYQMYSGYLVRILDIQRSGQIPQAILYETSLSQYAGSQLATTMQGVQMRFPDEIGKYVDWFVVEALGSVSKYPSEKSMQLVKQGPSPMASIAEKAQAAKAKVEYEKKLQADKLAAQEKIDFAANHFEVMPDLFVKKFKKERTDVAA